MRKTLEGSKAVAEAVKNCEPDVVVCYPITPSSHIAEKLAEFYASGELKDFITTESEFSSISCCLGASAAGSRAFTTTSSQGLALMHEALFVISGMRLPVVMAVGNRAISAPLNIWNDQEDSIVQRDSGWIQLYCETNQEAVDTMIQAFKIAESTLIPVMVCMDGFYLTHAVETVDIPSKEEIKKFLPKYTPALKLDTEAPVSLGAYATPKHYQDFRESLHMDLLASKEKIIEADAEFSKIFKRSYGGLVESYKAEDAEYIFLSMGSILGNAREVVDSLRKNGKKVGVVKIRSFRPLPSEEISKLLEGKKSVGIFEKAYSLGSNPPLYSDVIDTTYAMDEKPVFSSFVGGVGGRDVTTQNIEEIFKKIMQCKKTVEWVHTIK